jgi:uncharacterized protein
MINPYHVIEKYYAKGSELYKILVIHSEQVKEKALEIANRLPDLNLDYQFIAEASMLHDIGIYQCNAPRIYCNGTHQYIEHGYLGANLLRDLGLPKHALVCERHTGMGISLEVINVRQLPLPQRDMQPVSLEEKLICYADKFYSKTHLGKMHSIDHIRLQMSRFGDKDLLKFNILHALFEGQSHKNL